MKPLVIIGTGGHAREVLDVVEAINHRSPEYECLGFVVDEQYGRKGDLVDGLPILGGFGWFKGQTDVYVFCGVGYSNVRVRLVNRLNQYPVKYCSLIHPSAVLARRITIGEGVLISAGCVLANHIRIGNHAHINRNATVGHDTILQDYVTLSPGANISGNVTAKSGSFIGTGANIIEKKTIGEWSIVGAGGAVVHDVPANTTVVGVPARKIKEHPAGWHLHEE